MIFLISYLTNIKFNFGVKDSSPFIITDYKHNPISISEIIFPIKYSTKLETTKIINKKNLVVFKFDEIFTSKPSKKKFENVNNFVNLVITSFEPIKENTEVAIILISGGGSALFFERTYSNLKRLSNHGYKTYALVDTICASGCYMMACALDEIIAGNSSSIGSIGVFTKRYNGKKLSNIIGIEEINFKTSNKKGDIPFFDNPTKESINHVQEGINKTMKKFVSIIKEKRPFIDPKYFDADVWYSEIALEHKLIDKVQMVDDFLEEKTKTHNIIYIKELADTQHSHIDKFAQSASSFLDKIGNKLESNLFL